MLFHMRKRLTDLVSRSALLLFFIFTSSAYGQVDIEGDAVNGKSLFNSNCAACHKLDKKAIGPALADVTERRDLEWLYLWIKDNKALRESGDKDAKAIFEEYNGSVMLGFANLSDQDINDILRYTIEGGKPAADEVVAGGGSAASTEADGDNSVLLFILAGVLLFLVILLARVKNTLKEVQNQDTSNILEDANAITRTALKNPRIVTLLTILVAVVLLQQVYAGLIVVGVHQEYSPNQPIEFSHALHAGDNQIDCNYCHSGARKGKHSNIPAASVCMNCHMQIQEGPKYGTEEIAKIYDAVGWDPETYTYVENYETKPVKWVRIHNLPDLAYFNHAQHVTAGQIDCQTCHGPVEEMEKVYQYSPLTMGWCIDCHRETEVQMETNEYYAEMHEKLKEKYGEDANITVEMIGGLECGKCHY